MANITVRKRQEKEIKTVAIKINPQGNIKRAAVVCSSLFFSLVATISAYAVDNPQDPWEDFNRTIFGFNKVADSYVLKPVAKGYDWIMPEPLDHGVSNVFANLGETKNLLNNVLQGKVTDAGADITRLLINSTVGMLGLIDVASSWGVDKNEEDFGQTLASWGIASGPYLVLPLLTPSTVRDSIALIPDSYCVPQNHISHAETRWSVRALDTVDKRAGLFAAETLIQGDEYAFVRDIYLQRREFLVSDGAAEDDFLSDDFDEE